MTLNAARGGHCPSHPHLGPGEGGSSPPVFPDVGSMIVSPGFRVPSRSASSIIRRLIRSFTLPPALKNSHLATGSQRHIPRGRGPEP